MPVICNSFGAHIFIFLQRDDLLKYGKYCTKMPEAQTYVSHCTARVSTRLMYLSKDFFGGGGVEYF